jgi:hypothetical protein
VQRQYHSEEVQQMAQRKYDTPNFADTDFSYQWIIKVDDEFTVQVWVYLNRLIIANKKYAY